ncbi:MAG: hypothetical protein AAFS10_21420, partial [Myxococcota bacterium]
MTRDRNFLEEIPFARQDYASIVQTNYPGAHDTDYRARVAGLVKQSEAAWPAIPEYHYTDEEHTTWRLVSEILIRLQDHYSCQAYLEGREKLALPIDRVPPDRPGKSSGLEGVSGSRRPA